MKKRKIGYTYGSVSGHFPFRKQRSIAFESTLERDLLVMLEFNDSVYDVVEQPVTIEYTNKNGRETTYTPDFLVYFEQPDEIITKIRRKPLLIEVKPHNILLCFYNCSIAYSRNFRVSLYMTIFYMWIATTNKDMFIVKFIFFAFKHDSI